MRSTFKLDNPDDMQATMTLTMSVKEWRQLRKQLSDSWPSCDFSRQIGDLVRAAEAHFYANDDARKALGGDDE
jgi:hypothetical protein